MTRARRIVWGKQLGSATSALHQKVQNDAGKGLLDRCLGKERDLVFGGFEADTATGTGTWAFLRSFGILWGISIPAAVFNNKTVKLSAQIGNPATLALMANGQAYQHATAAFIETLPALTRVEVVGVFADSLKLAGEVVVAFAVLGFVLVFMEKQIKLRTEMDTEYGIKESARKPGKACRLGNDKQDQVR